MPLKASDVATINLRGTVHGVLDRVNRCVLVKGCRLTRMSDVHYGLLRDPGPVKGVRGMRRHEVNIDFSWRGLVEGFRRLTPVERSRQLPEYQIIADGRGLRHCLLSQSLSGSFH